MCDVAGGKKYLKEKTSILILSYIRRALYVILLLERQVYKRMYASPLRWRVMLIKIRGEKREFL